VSGSVLSSGCKHAELHACCARHSAIGDIVARIYEIAAQAEAHLESLKARFPECSRQLALML
jgi:hypothetical protein